MKNHLFLYALLIITVLLMVGCTPGIPQLPIDNLQGDEADQENQDEATGVPRVVFIELFNTDGCASSKVVNPIMEEIVAEYENTVVILVEEAGWGIYSTEETSERFKWYFSDKSELHTPSVCFDGLNQLFAEGLSLGGGGNSGNSGNENVGDAGDNEDPETVEVDITKPVITGSRDPLPNSFGWNNTDVTVSFSCVDTNPVKFAFKINTVAGKTLTKEGKNQSATNTGVLIDAAGNTADPVTVSNINIDKTPPKVTITLPGTGEYVLNQSILATWSAADALSGVDSSVSGSVSIDTSSVGTKTFTLPAGTAKDKAGNSSLEVTKSYTVISDAEDQWAQDNGFYEFQIGNEEEYHNDDDTMTDAQLITNLKAVATDVQEIFTNGNVSYSCGNSNIGDWVTAGKGDLDIMASNVYMTWGAGHPEDWEDMIDDLVGAFGTDGTYLTEFSLNTDSLDSYSTDEAVQAAAVTEMIEYIKASGMERALFYSWHDYSGGLFGVLKDDGTYRLLWSQALLNSESIKFATVPAKTTTVSLPNTIALLPK